MVKNIAQIANGAQIKINSEKDSKRNLREVSVAINGTLEGKYRAAHLIIEQVEIFKNGGPVSTSLYVFFNPSFRSSKAARSSPKTWLPRYKIQDCSKTKAGTETEAIDIAVIEEKTESIERENTRTQKIIEEESTTPQVAAEATRKEACTEKDQDQNPIVTGNQQDIDQEALHKVKI